MKNRTKSPLRRKCANLAKRSVMLLCSAVTLALALGLVGYVLYRGLPSITTSFLTTSPSYLNDNIGIFPNLLNTVYILIATLLIVLPLGAAAAIEYAAETLSGIPSIIYGLVGMLVFCRFMKLQTCLLSGALTLVIMNLPTVMRTVQESLKAVPQSYRDGAFALGAGKWRVIRTVVIPNCIDGIITGCILSAGRILGESAALLFTAGFANLTLSFPAGLKSAGSTLTVALYVYAKEEGEFGVAFAIAAILAALALIIHLAAELTAFAFKRRRNV